MEKKNYIAPTIEICEFDKQLIMQNTSIEVTNDNASQDCDQLSKGASGIWDNFDDDEN